jgi:hypothetical protein
MIIFNEKKNKKKIILNISAFVVKIGFLFLEKPPYKNNKLQKINQIFTNFIESLHLIDLNFDQFVQKNETFCSLLQKCISKISFLGNFHYRPQTLNSNI